MHNHPFFPFVNTNGQKKRFSLLMKKKKQKPIERLLHGERERAIERKERQRNREAEIERRAPPDLLPSL